MNRRLVETNATIPLDKIPEGKKYLDVLDAVAGKDMSDEQDATYKSICKLIIEKKNLTAKDVEKIITLSKELSPRLVKAAEKLKTIFAESVRRNTREIARRRNIREGDTSLRGSKRRIREGERVVNNFKNSLGHYLVAHKDEVSTCRTNEDLVNLISGALGNGNDRYVNKIITDIQHQPSFKRNWQNVYNILLAGYGERVI